MPAPKPPEFRRRAVELARLREKPIAQIAKDLGIAESGLRRWMAQADIDDGRKQGLSSDERAELVELRRRNRVLEMENEILKRASAYLRPGERAPKIGFRLVHELAADGFPCRGGLPGAPGVPSGYYGWRPAGRQRVTSTTRTCST